MILSILNYNNVKYISEHKNFFPFLRKPSFHGIYFLPDNIFVNQVYGKREYS